MVRIIQTDKVNPQKQHSLSRWVFRTDVDNSILLRSSLSKQVFLMTREEWAAVERRDFTSPATEELARMHLLVETDYDEMAEYAMVSAVLSRLEYGRPGTGTYTILPTTGCNARCVYCFEQGVPVRSMSPETADRVVDFICKTRQKDAVKLKWFGGEPLCASGIISRICLGLQIRGVEYTSAITTNGSLFTPDMICEAVELWHLKRAQVSMDGAREDYEKKKRYIRPDLHNYDVVMENIRLLAEAGVDVAIRCNSDRNNISSVCCFIDECAMLFSDMEKIRLSPSLLQQEFRGQESTIAGAIVLKDLKNYAAARGFQQPGDLSVCLKAHQCMADSGGKSILIDPEGGLHSCDVLVDDAPLGSIYDDTPPVWPTDPSDPAEECRQCCFLPDCTKHYKKACPLCLADCREVLRINTAEAMKKLQLSSSVTPGAAEDDAEDEIC